MKILVKGDYACFTRPEMKVERFSYEVPTPGALEGLLKSIYWKPAIRYVIDRIIVCNPIRFKQVRINEVKDKISYSDMNRFRNAVLKEPLQDVSKIPVLFTSDVRSQRASTILADVCYGIEFHLESTGIRCENEQNSEVKHAEILMRRLEKGQYFRVPCLGASAYTVSSIQLLEKDFNAYPICDENLALGNVDLGFMLYRLAFTDKGHGGKPPFSDTAEAVYYHPHMVSGVIDVQQYREGLTC